MSKKHETQKQGTQEKELFCGYCGERLPDLEEGEIGGCPECKHRFGKRRKTRRPPPPPRDDYYGASFDGAINRFTIPGFKDPVLGALLSAIVPGAGQVYNMQFVKGLLVFLTCWLVIPYFLGIFDAYLTAEKTNRWQTVMVRRQ
jgi:hypothetical protein